MQKKIPDERVMEIVETASTKPPGEQEAFIRKVCAGDTELEQCVTDYVHWMRVIGDFMENAAVDLLPAEEYFRPDDVLLNRFRVIREAGRGGMGIVYEAFDQLLEKRVALKCAHSGFDRELIGEVRNASEVSHPNVCRIFAIHHAPTPEGEEIGFIAMEYLEGPTLADRIDPGPLPEPEAKKIAIELCRGLFAAHRNGVIHGDLKTNNILLAKGADGVTRAVITDFGLARRGGPGAGRQSGLRGGAPKFLAPEIRQGAAPSVESDIYSLGVVLHMMVTGQEPKEGKVHGKVGPKWRAVLAKMLDADPTRRFRSADEIARALDPPPQRWMSVGAATVLIAMLFWPPRDQVRLAVLPFSATGSAQAAADKLHAEASEQIFQLQGDKGRALQFLSMEKLRRAGADSPEEARELGATHAVTASVRDVNGRYVVEAAVVDVSSGIKTGSWTAEYSAEELAAAPVALAGVVSGGLHLPSAPTEQMTEDVAADYRLGLSLAQDYAKSEEALEVYERAAAKAPQSALIAAASAEACFNLHWLTNRAEWLERAKDYLRQAERSNPDLPEVRKAAGYLEFVSGHPYAAIPHYERASELRPSDSSLWRRLGQAYEMANLQERAQDALHKAIACEPGSVRAHQQLGAYYYRHGNYPAAIVSFRRAIERAPENASAHFALGAALVESGEFAEGEREFRASAKIQDSSNVQNSIGVALMYQRRDAEAMAYFRKALELEPDKHLALLNLGIAARRTGRSAEAVQANRRALAVVQRDVAAHPQDWNLRALLANLSAACGDRRSAEFEAAQASNAVPHSIEKRWRLVATYELLGAREKSLQTLSDAPLPLLEDLARWPDNEALVADLRFQSLLANARKKETK